MAAFAFTLLPFLPLLVWILLVGWSPNNTEGEVLLVVPVPALARLKMLAVPFALGLAVLLMGVFIGHVHWWLIAPLMVLYILMLSIPISYRLTTVGIRIGKGQFRRWTEFASVRRSRYGARLIGSQRAASYPIYLSGNREDDDFVLTLKNLVRDSYKGQAIESDRIRSGRNRNHSAGEISTTSSINH